MPTPASRLAHGPRRIPVPTWLMPTLGLALLATAAVAGLRGGADRPGIQAAPRPAQEPPLPEAPAARAFHVAGHWGGAAQALALSADGRTAFLGQGPRIWTLGLGDGQAPPRILGLSEVLPGPVRDLALVEDRLYAAGRTGGVWAMDVTDPARLRLLGHDPGVPTVLNMVADGRHRVYMARGFYTITLADFADPASPLPLACAVFEDGAGVWDVASSGEMIYLAMQEAGLRSMDLKDPMLPMLRGGLAAIDGAPLFVTAVTQQEGLVLAGDGPRLRVIDWRDPDHPRPLATLTLPEQDLKTLSLRGKAAFALAQGFLDGALWLHRIDLSRPPEPRLAQSWRLGVPEEGLGAEDGYALALAQTEGRLVLAAGSLGLRSFLAPGGTADDADWREGASFLAAPWAEGIDAGWRLAAAGAAGLWQLGEDGPVLDPAGSTSPAPYLGLAQDSPGQALSGAGHPAQGPASDADPAALDPADYFLADGSGGLRWYRRQPATGGSPLRDAAVLETLPAPRRLALAPAGDTAYVADPLSGLHRVRALTAGAEGPRLEDLGILDLGPDYPEDLAITADPPRLWVAHGGGVSFFALEDDGEPRLLARSASPGFASDVAAGPGGLVAVADGMAGLSLLRPDGTGAWSLWRSVSTPGDAQRVALSTDGRLAFVADLSGSLLAYDLSTDPPALGASFPLPFPVVDLAVDAEGTLWLAARAGGVYRLRLGGALPTPTVTPTPRGTPLAHETPGSGHLPTATASGPPAARLSLPLLSGGAGPAGAHP